MAESMSAWVLERDFPVRTPARQLRVLLHGQKESDWVLFMEQFCAAHPAIDFSSLPSFRKNGTRIELGLRGEPLALGNAWQTLRVEIEQRGVDWEWVEDPQLT